MPNSEHMCTIASSIPTPLMDRVNAFAKEQGWTRSLVVKQALMSFLAANDSEEVRSAFDRIQDIITRTKCDVNVAGFFTRGEGINMQVLKKEEMIRLLGVELFDVVRRNAAQVFYNNEVVKRPAIARIKRD